MSGANIQIIFSFTDLSADMNNWKFIKYFELSGALIYNFNEREIIVTQSYSLRCCVC